MQNLHYEMHFGRIQRGQDKLRTTTGQVKLQKGGDSAASYRRQRNGALHLGVKKEKKMGGGQGMDKTASRSC